MWNTKVFSNRKNGVALQLCAVLCCCGTVFPKWSTAQVGKNFVMVCGFVCGEERSTQHLFSHFYGSNEVVGFRKEATCVSVCLCLLAVKWQPCSKILVTYLGAANVRLRHCWTWPGNGCVSQLMSPGTCIMLEKRPFSLLMRGYNNNRATPVELQKLVILCLTLKVLKAAVVANSLQAFAVLNTWRCLVSDVVLPLADFPLHNVYLY